jgi:hypothetical protein
VFLEASDVLGGLLLMASNIPKIAIPMIDPAMTFYLVQLCCCWQCFDI